MLLSCFLFIPTEKPVAQIVQAPTEKVASVVSPPKEITPGLPVRLVVPKIKIDANILNMGITKAGDMEVPKKVKDAGWYKYGPYPGNKGSAVIAGHLNGLKSEPGIFTDLDKLSKGDDISVIDEKGQTISFVVRETRTYDQNEQPTEVFQSTNEAHLNLITCTGTWDKAQKRFLKRLVIFADKSS